MDEKFVFDPSPSASDEEQAGELEQIAGLTKIETIDYRWFIGRGERCTALELRRKEELDRKRHAALSADAIGKAASELAALKQR
jgi:hypothetical protein